MATFNTYYVNFGSGNDSTGDGSSGTPWKTLQKALTSGSLGTDGTQIYCIGTTDTYSSSLTTTMTATAAKPIYIIGSGYSGRSFPEIANATSSLCGAMGNWNIFWAHMKLNATGGRIGWGQHNFFDCILASSSTDYAIYACSINSCECTSTGASLSDGWKVAYGGIMASYVEATGYDANSRLVQLEDGGEGAIGNIIYNKGASGNGIRIYGHSQKVRNNTIVGSSGTGAGVYVDNDNFARTIVGNIIINFSGANGVPIKAEYGAGVAASNAYYNCTSGYTLTGSDWEMSVGDNELTDASPILASGSLTYANRLVYCKPVNTGNVLNPTYGHYKGAVRPYASSLGLTPELLKDDEVIDDVTGTLAAGGGGGSASGFPRRMMKLG